MLLACIAFCMLSDLGGDKNILSFLLVQVPDCQFSFSHLVFGVGISKTLGT